MTSRSVVHLATSDMAVRYLLLDQLRHLASRGYDVSATCSARPHADAVRTVGTPVRAVRLTRRISPLDDAIAFVQLLWLLRRLRPDVVQTRPRRRHSSANEPRVSRACAAPRQERLDQLLVSECVAAAYSDLGV